MQRTRTTNGSVVCTYNILQLLGRSEMYLCQDARAGDITDAHLKGPRKIGNGTALCILYTLPLDSTICEPAGR